MNKNISKIIEDLITECECDNRIETGIFEIHNADHLVVLSEHMVSHGISEEIIEEAIEAMTMDEGKYPERQAYNKEGWLVTFPSKEYRDAAIKKRTHFSSDPTHGKGGMNLYYKRKGKQKRQKTQGQSAVEPQGQQPNAQVPAQAPAVDKNKPIRTPEEEEEFQRMKAAYKISPKRDTDAVAKYMASRDPNFRSASDQAPASKTSGDSSQKEPSEKAPAAPAIDVPVVTQPPEQYATVSKKFAEQKGWKAEPYGEYRNQQGEAVAVVGLSGEVVPIKNTDREEYKIFAEKNIPQA
jgi:hypothetical protein